MRDERRDHAAVIGHESDEFLLGSADPADAEERAIVLGIMNAFGYAVNAWLPYLVFPAVEAPEFHKGFIFSSVMFVAQAGITWLVWFMHRRDVRKKAMPVA